MKFLTFKDATHFTKALAKTDGKEEVIEIPFYTRSGFTVVHIQFSNDELQELKREEGKFFLILGPGVDMPPPLLAQVKYPFVPADTKIIKLNGHAKDQDQKSTGDNE